MKKMKYRKTVFVSLLLMAALFAVMLAACSAKTLPEGFDGEEVKQAASDIVDLINDRDYEGVAARFAPVMSSALDAEGLESALSESLDKLGEFESIKSLNFGGGSSELTGDYAIVVLRCRYSEGSASYVICIDSDGLICGLYLK